MAATVLIVDDHAGFRSFARALLEAEGFDVVGEAADGASALAAARALAPELVLLDVALPDMDGFAVCDALLEEGAGPAVVLTSSRDVSSYRRRLKRSRARGFIPKSELSGPHSPRSRTASVHAAPAARVAPGGYRPRCRGEWVSYQAGDLALVVADAVVGLVLVTCGVVAWERRGESRVGPLMILSGYTWFAGNFWS